MTPLKTNSVPVLNTNPSAAAMNNRFLRCHVAHCFLLAGLLLAAPAGAQADEEMESLPEGLEIVSIDVIPPAVSLKSGFEYRQIQFRGNLKTGETADLTRMVKLTTKPATVAVSALGLVTPVADGQEQLTFVFQGREVTVAVEVSGAQQTPPISFVQDVQPTFSRLGCNAGTCHGSRTGKNGFKLSLRGYDSLFDHRAFTDDIGARRLNRAAPDQSLMLLKATGSIPHVGGVRTNPSTTYYQMIRQWIAEGAKLDLDAPRVQSVEILPQNPVLPRAGMRQQMTVLATYQDGSVRDVTREAFIESGNIEVLEADESGLLTLLRRGESPVLVRYEGAYAATTLTAMGDRTGFAWQEPEHYNYIDKHVYAKLQRVKILPSEVCGDAEFLRRVYLDLTGLPPEIDATRKFLVDPRPSREKRAALVDQLIGNAEYVEHWTNKWADMLQVNRKFLGEQGSIAMRNWIKDVVARNQPYDETARQILTASGSTIESPPASYFKILRDPALIMENTTHLFLAVRFNCNKCHDHPFERWTQDQYYQLAAFFSQIGFKEDPLYRGKKIGGSAVEGAKPLVEVVFDKNAGEVTHIRTGETAPPVFPYSHDDLAATTASRREQLSQWITSPKNQYFARSYVNRLWGYLFGTGIIEPIDDIRAGNPATNPELLDALEKDFVANGFNVQHMLRLICNSRTYQHSISANEWNQDDTINYARAIPRRLPAEVLYDAIHLATGSQQRIPGVPAGFRAAELPDVGVKVPFLDDFGRPVRESSCECERSSSMVLGPIMKLINGPTVADAVSDPQNALTRLVAEQPDDRKLLENLFLRFLSRAPSEDELAIGLEALKTAGDGHPQLLAELDTYKKSLLAKQAAWEKTLVSIPEWTVLKPSEMKSAENAEMTLQEDLSIRVMKKADKDVYTVVATTELSDITGIRLEALPDDALANKGPGLADNGNFVVSEFTVASGPQGDPASNAPVVLTRAVADYSQKQYDISTAIDGKDAGGWAVAPEFGKPHTAFFETKTNLGQEGGTRLTFTIRQQFGSKHMLGKFRLSLTQAPRPLRIDALPAELAQAIAVPADQRNDAQREVIYRQFTKGDRTLADLEASVKRSAEQLKNRRLSGVQDLAWALINNAAFLFNH